MVNLPKKKIGIVACSGEELPEGTITRLAALMVLEELRPDKTVTICLPLFLAGGEGDRAFARFYPTIAIDGCDKRCAARGTEMYSSRPAASLVVSDLVREFGLEAPEGNRNLNPAGSKAVDFCADRIAAIVDELLEARWSRRSGEIIPPEEIEVPQEPVEATCSCGSGIPVQKVLIDGQETILIALSLIFEQVHQAGKQPSEAVAQEIFETVKVYNPVTEGSKSAYIEMLLREYIAYCRKREMVHG